ncbi:diguanylate cyclase [Ideonella sp. DXS22W]|uniref:Diguanylate cyclase n=1 Tax=Pseudaquabacterium inlustre TaxID=2984192 RepID=A0ABU9CKU1_9BURK
MKHAAHELGWVQAVAGAAPRILLVDDMAAIHDDFRKILGGTPPVDAGLDDLEAALFESAPSRAGPSAAPGFELDSAYQGSEALVRVRTAAEAGRPYALAFVDMRMPPGWDGVQTIEQLWRVDPALQVVICTAYSDYAWEEVLDRLDAKHRLMILKKPFDAIEVSQLAHTLCAKWQADHAVARHTEALEREVQLRLGELREANQQLQQELAERQRREADLQLAASVFHNALNGIVVTDERARIVSVNPAFTRLTGYEPHEAVGQTLRLLRTEADRASRADDLYHQLWLQLLATGEWSGELWSQRKDGSRFCEWLSLNRVPVPPGQPRRFVGLMADVTEQRRQQDSWRQQALHDPLTGLANRAHLHGRVDEALLRAQRGGAGCCLLFLDLDRFKPINDRLGHDVGDALLREVAERLKALIRHDDLAARLGGDEFVLLLDGAEPADCGERVADRVLASLALPVQVGEHSLQIGVSVGIAYGPLDGADRDTLMKQADAAMYLAKARGRQCWHRHGAAPAGPADPAASI